MMALIVLAVLVAICVFAAVADQTGKDIRYMDPTSRRELTMLFQARDYTDAEISTALAGGTVKARADKTTRPERRTGRPAQRKAAHA